MNYELSNFNVYYGWSVLNKIRKKVSLSVIFENEISFSDRSKNHIARLQKTFYVRRQTVAESQQGMAQNRTLTEYSLFLNQKPFSGDIEKLLDSNYQADINNVPAPVLQEIRDALRAGFKKVYQNVKS